MIPIGENLRVLCECGCGQETGFYQGRRNRFASQRCASQRSGAEHPGWRGGASHMTQGYWYDYVGPEYEHRIATKNVQRRCILVAERALGKRLPHGAEVHHVNGIKSDDRNQNLVVCQDRAYHRLIEKRQRALDATGDASMLPCRICKEYDRPENLSVLSKGRSAGLAQHRTCRTKQEAARRAS